MRITISGRKIQFHRNISMAALFLIFFVKVAAQNTMDFTYDDNGNITSRFVVSNPVEDEEKTEEVDSVLSEDDYMFDQMPNMKTGKGTKYSACVAPSPTTGPIRRITGSVLLITYSSVKVVVQGNWVVRDSSGGGMSVPISIKSKLPLYHKHTYIIK